MGANEKSTVKEAVLRPRRKQSGLRFHEDTLRAIAVMAAQNDVPKWVMADALLRKALGLPPLDAR